MASNHRTTGPFRPVVVGALLLGGAVCVFATMGWTGPPPPSPGIPIARTVLDQQHAGSAPWQVGRLPGSDIVHFVWGYGDFEQSLEEFARFVSYNSYSVSTGTLNQGFDGCIISSGINARAASPGLGIGSNNDAHAFMHQRADLGLPYSSWHVWLPTPGSCSTVTFQLPGNVTFGEMVWPRGNVQRNSGGTDIVHAVAHGANEDPQDRIVYWRYNGTSWEGPVAIDSSPSISYVVTADPNSGQAAIVIHADREPNLGGVRNVAYYESQTEGVGWISGAELGDANKVILTNYTDPLGPEAYLHVSATYDNSSRLHIVWDELRLSGQPNQVAIRHWNSERGTIRPVALGYWDAPLGPSAFDQNLAKVTIGVGDGATPCQGGATTNFDHVYVLYTRFAGPTLEEQADHSAAGYYNGELYLNVSADGGLSWSRPLNLTNTKTPGCDPGSASYQNPEPPRPDSVCRSEHWASIGEMVHDIDIIYISDLDAGSALGGEGTMQLDPVMYLRLPGGTTDAPYLCPPLDAQMTLSLSQPGACGFHADVDAADTAALTIGNQGNATLVGTATAMDADPFPMPPSWLSIDGAPGVNFTILPGEPDLTFTLAMDATGLSPGLHQAIVSVSHNDTTQPSPQDIVVDFVVAPCLCHGDPQCDGVFDVLDVTAVVGEAFRGTPPVTSPFCPHVSNCDLNCDCVVDVRDVVGLIGWAFRGEAVVVCDPCAQPCA